MNLAAHQRAESAVDQLVPLDHPFAHELVGNDGGLEMRVVLGIHPHAGTGQSGFD
jgi:hypothetical protein